jgi:hypothetical protein
MTSQSSSSRDAIDLQKNGKDMIEKKVFHDEDEDDSKERSKNEKLHQGKYLETDSSNQNLIL